MSKLELDWLIEPLDEETNDILFNLLSAENAIRGYRDIDEHLRNLWLCESFDDVERLLRSRPSRSLKFKIFYRPRGEREITECALLSRVSKRRLSRISQKGKKR